MGATSAALLIGDDHMAIGCSRACRCLGDIHRGRGLLEHCDRRAEVSTDLRTQLFWIEVVDQGSAPVQAEVARGRGMRQCTDADHVDAERTQRRYAFECDAARYFHDGPTVDQSHRIAHLFIVEVV